MANEYATKVVTGDVRLSYVNLFKTRTNDDGVEKYDVMLLIPKNDSATLGRIKAAVEQATQKGLDEKWKGKKPTNFRLPLRDGDAEFPDQPQYAGMLFMNVSCKADRKPQVVKFAGKQADGKNKFDPADETEVYSGCWARVSINFFPYDAKGNKGVSGGLNSVVKTRDDENLAGATDVNAEFANEDFGDIGADAPDWL